jgi:putative methylase
MVRNKRELEIILEKTPKFKSPSKKLEQYPCDSSVASELLWNAYIYGNIKDRIIADFGCGTGVLSYGALILGAKEVLCIDIDYNALSIAKKFLENISIDFPIHYICCDIRKISLRSIDTVVMNPPFGVYIRGIDMKFLEQAFGMSPLSIYSIHKYNPKSHKLITKLANKKGYIAQIIAIKNMAIHATYKNHIKNVHRFKISIYRFVSEGLNNG